MTDETHGRDPRDEATATPEGGAETPATDETAAEAPRSDADDAAAPTPAEGEGDAAGTERTDGTAAARGPAPARVEYDEATLRRYVEAMLFVAPRPLTVPQVARSLRTNFAAVRRTFRALVERYESCGVQVAEVGGAYQFRTAPECADAVRRLLDVKPLRLSKAAMEALAVVAYRQPATKPDVDDIRGVDSGSAIKLLLDRNLVRVLGRKEEPGRPLLYGTTQAFLEFFGLASLSDLPSLREYTELTDDGKRQLERDLFARPAEPLKEYLEDTSFPAPRARRWDDLVEVLGDDLGGLPEGVEVETGTEAEAEADVREPMSEADVREPMSEADVREPMSEAEAETEDPTAGAEDPDSEEEDE